MPRPVAPIVFIAIFLAVVIAAVLMFAIVLARHDAPPTSTPKAAIALQLALLQSGDAVALRLTFLEGVRGEITPELVEERKPAYEGRTVEDLADRITLRDLETGERVAEVVDATGRPLTYLVLVEGDWLADRVWFR